MTFKVGDRCSFYRDGERYEGTVETASDNPHSSIWVRVTKAPKGNPEALTWGFTVHPTQCRRLKPKQKPREWHVRESALIGRNIAFPKELDSIVHVREVLK